MNNDIRAALLGDKEAEKRLTDAGGAVFPGVLQWMPLAWQASEVFLLP